MSHSQIKVNKKSYLLNLFQFICESSFTIAIKSIVWEYIKITRKLDFYMGGVKPNLDVVVWLLEYV